MKGGAQTALAIGVGYILGRRRKMRLATMLALGAATGAVSGLGPAVLKRGAKMLGSTDLAGTFGPQVNEIVSTIRGDLLDAGKAAATAAVSSRMDSLSDTLHERAETFRNPEAAVAGAGQAAGKAGGTVRRAGGSVGRLRRRSRNDVDEEYLEQDEEERHNGRSRSAGRRAARAEPDEVEAPDSEFDEDEDEEPYEDELDEPDAADDIDEDEAEAEAEAEAEEPAPRRTRTSRSPVARTRR
jgi:hypothetical protein